MFGGVLMRILTILSGAVSALCLTAVAPTAEPAPRTYFGSPIPMNSAAPEPTSLYRMFAGRSADWGAGSFAYFAPDGTFRAVNAAEQSIGEGRWFVTTNSKMCYDANWMWRQDFSAQSSKVLTCARFRVDNAGEMWSTTGSRAGPWFPFSTANLKRGDLVTPQFTAFYNSFGVAPGNIKK
ncbi:DUF995 domain-containing protein [Epibacterium sp. SM1979]|uniref:DUF995 domain-containing protein n=2 Tax=Tritonibacter litoralis TaxID=2662264 RepID=A0A843YJA1_9RHOB|nr:DUF995 domain-containing protein [Tritonibacter litoralis]